MTLSKLESSGIFKPETIGADDIWVLPKLGGLVVKRKRKLKVIASEVNFGRLTFLMRSLNSAIISTGATNSSPIAYLCIPDVQPQNA
jgi:hypothetical protein